MSKTPKSKAPTTTKTLFSYFQKTPTTDKTGRSAGDDDRRRRRSAAEGDDTAAKKSPPKERRPPAAAGPHRVPHQEEKGNGKRKTDPRDDLSDDLGVGAYDLVWAKLEGHPWWPSIVCFHPKSNEISRKQGKSRLVHVQFFDDPPTRGWVKSKFIKPFTGSDCKEYQRGGQLFSADVKCRKGAEEADAALKLAKKDRAALIVAMESSDSEDESMDVDDEISNSENGASDNEECKENETPPNHGSNRKSPKKLTRSATGKRPAKRRRIVVESDDEDAKSDHSAEDNFKPDSEDESNSDEDEMDSSDAVESEEVETDSESAIDSPVKPSKRAKPEKRSSKKKEQEPQGVVRKNMKKVKSSKSSPKQTASSSQSSENVSLNSSFVSDATKSKLAAFSSNETNLGSSSGSSDGRNFPHMSLDFLQPDKVRDAEKRTRDDPNYDPRTLYIPESFLAKQTPAMLQWWILKASHFDTVLFFKMGKFYELFHMDAMIAVNELNLIFMKGEHAHSGFPEIAYGRYSDMLIQKGYKIARIEQTETPETMAERCKQMRNCSKSDKVVKREICSIQTKGTKRYSFIDGDAGSSTSNFLLAVCEKVDSGTAGTYGVCFVDTSIGKFYVGQFQDDRHGSRLRTLISHYPPVQVLCERGRLSEKTKTIFSSNLATVMKEELRTGTEFWDSSTTLKFLAESDYFKDDSKMEDGFNWPDALKEMIADAETLGRTAVVGYELGLSALGAVVWYLRHCLMDEELLSMKNFANYSPVDLLTQPSPRNSSEVSTKCSTIFGSQKRLVLDGVTLANLDVLVNSTSGSTEGTLLERVQHCCTAFGKRVFKQWICAPLCNPSSINDRLDAVEDLMKITDIVADVSEMMKKLPDLERLLNKIHVLGSARRSKDHPDSRAIFFEDNVYSKRKIEDFLLTLEGFKMATKLVSKFDSVSVNFRSKLLKQCVVLVDAENLGKFPDLKKHLEFFDRAFDHQKAKSAGVIKPSKGVNMDYDQAVADIQMTEEALNSYLEKQRKLLGCKNISYWGTGRNRFQMEIPESSLKNIPDSYEVTSQRKGFRRYQTDEIKRLHSQLTDAEERRDAAQKDTMRCVFHQFDGHYNQWNEAVQCLAVLDVLISLLYYSSHGDGSMCRPELVLPEDVNYRPFIEIRNGRHPCIGRTFSGGDFIPNDTVIGLAEEEDQSAAQIVLVTGPNMGGKSTLMRQVGTIVILAQLGCYVPAEKCRLTPVDRVFTRLGASDNIIGGESTFFVELSETSAILQHATEHSLVLLDELGRGTATYDGNAIACAVVKELSENIQCRTLFSTHYHSLVEEFSHDLNIRLGHMACMVENENDEDPSQETITFLYQFASGACPKSYGFNAARLATIPDEVIKLAHKKAREFEDSVRIMKTFRKIWTLEKSEVNKLKELLNSVDELL